MFSRLPGKVSRCDVDFVKRKQKVFREGGKLCSYGMKTISVTEISPVSKQDLGTRENFSSHMNAMQLFILFHKQGEVSLVNLSKCFLGNRDIFCPYKQAPSIMSNHDVTNMVLNDDLGKFHDTI